MFIKLNRHWVSSIMSSKRRKLQVWNLAQSEISAATLIRPENTIWSWCCSDKQSSCGMGLSSMILHLWHCDWPLSCWCFEEVPLPWKASNMQSRNTRRHSPAQGGYSELRSSWQHTDMLHWGHAATNKALGGRVPQCVLNSESYDNREEEDRQDKTTCHLVACNPGKEPNSDRLTDDTFDR